MSKRNKIQLTEEEGLKIIVELDQIVVSLAKIKNHFAEDSDFQKHDKMLSDYIINEKVNQTLVQIKDLLSSKFSLNLGEDNIDLVEKACENNYYWSAKEEDSNLEDWHQQHLEKLIKALINDFEYIYQLMQKKKQHIYAFALILDSDCITAYSAVSTIESLKKLHKNKDWDAAEWCWTVDESKVKKGLNNFTPYLLEHYRNDITPLFKQEFDYEPERQKNIQLFTNAMNETKQKMVEKYGNEIEEMVFYLSIPGDPDIEKSSALAINHTGNAKVNELLASLSI
ncbi:DUF4303 domain-containing protein [Empedobacter brevis]|uniref:DUF4303 domain-containing protein n=1 Tax=Empedobacter brevis TaxID=247 RepID=UPI00123DCB75|nr:DUF4303 domain-containing protein [Empedobacter brevis]QES93926.1 DUF4303 domain-containing protein [Empedobacter brevis]